MEGLLDLARRHKRILVFGAGGGGDVLGAFLIYRRLRLLGAEPILGSVVWERWQLDPFPGPIPLESLAGGEPIGWSAALVDGETVAVRYGATIKPQIVRAAEALGEKTLFLDLSKGGEGLRQALEDAASELGVTAFIGVDTGGDILALGCEDNLWSPLADAISLYALNHAPGESLVAVLGPGADGELEPDRVLRYIAAIARKGGLVEVTGLTRGDLRAAEPLEKAVVSEASRIPLRAMRGETGVVEIRGGARRVAVTPCQATAYILEARTVYEWSPLAPLVAGTRGINQASQALNERCVVTELDLEVELSRLRETGTSRPVTLTEIKGLLRSALFRRGCEPILRDGCDAPEG